MGDPPPLPAGAEGGDPTAGESESCPGGERPRCEWRGGMSGLRRPRVSLTSLGCKVNQYEMRVAAEELLGGGFEIVPFGAAADACIVNTCSVTHEADVKSRSVLRRAARCGDDPLVVATGCYADVAPQEVGAVSGVAEVVANRDKPRLADIVEDV